MDIWWQVMKLFIQIISIIIGCYFGYVLSIWFIKNSKYLHSRRYYKKQNEWLLYVTQDVNTLIAGLPRTGKGLLMAQLIYLRGEKHYCTQRYNNQTEVIDVVDVSMGENTYEDVLQGIIRPFERVFEKDCRIYLPDTALTLPCQYWKELDKNFKSMPLFFPLTGQMHNYIVADCQQFNRLWDKLREQMGAYILVDGHKEFKKYFILDILYYEKYETALSGRGPYYGFNRIEFERKNGKIEQHSIKVYKKYLEYDTEYFAHKFLIEEEKITAVKENMNNV